MNSLPKDLVGELGLYLTAFDIKRIFPLLGWGWVLESQAFWIRKAGTVGVSKETFTDTYTLWMVEDFGYVEYYCYLRYCNVAVDWSELVRGVSRSQRASNKRRPKDQRAECRAIFGARMGDLEFIEYIYSIEESPRRRALICRTVLRGNPTPDMVTFALSRLDKSENHQRLVRTKVGVR